MNFQQRYHYNPKTDLLGKGGFAKVYKAIDTVLSRTVAIKIFSSEVCDRHDLVAEISRVIQLEHPNLCRYYDLVFEDVVVLGETQRLQIGIMEYLDGGDLKTYLRQHPGKLDQLLNCVLQALSFLHKRGIIHRDLKAQNILIKNTDEGPIAKLTDFGISKNIDSENNSSSVLIGTIEYMAPEQFNPSRYGINGKINTNLDLWSFGLMTYELLTGESMFGNRKASTSAEQIMSNILDDDIVKDKLNNLWEPYKTVISKCLIKDASQRVQDAEVLIKIMSSQTTSEETIVIPKHKLPNDTLQMPWPGITNEEKTVLAVPALAGGSKKKNKKWLMPLTTVVILLMGVSIWVWVSSNKFTSSSAITVITDSIRNDNDEIKAVLAGFFSSLFKHNFLEVKKYATEESKSMIDLIEAELQSKDTGVIEKYNPLLLTVGETRINGDRAIVPVRDRTGEIIYYTLKKQNAGWKVAFDKNSMIQTDSIIKAEKQIQDKVDDNAEHKKNGLKDEKKEIMTTKIKRDDERIKHEQMSQKDTVAYYKYGRDSLENENSRPRHHKKNMDVKTPNPN